MRAPSCFARRSGELEVKMTPMIDVVFLLLIFFVWTTSFQIQELTLPSNLTLETTAQPNDAQAPGPEADFDDVVVRVLWRNGAPAWRLNDAEVSDLEELQQRLKTVALIKSDAPVIVHPDPDTQIDYVVRAYDAARLAGFRQVRFAVTGE